MATITYKDDIAPHLQRSLMYRRLRMQRWQVLHKDYYKNYDAATSSLSAKTSQFFNLLVEVIAVACFVAGATIFSALKLGRISGPVNLL